MNASTVGSIVTSSMPQAGSLRGDGEQHRQGHRRNAPSPTTPPMSASSRLSTSRLRRDASSIAAPNAARIASSCPRDLGSHELEIRDVRAGDEQQHADRAHEHPQHVVQVADDVVLQRCANSGRAACASTACSREPRHDRKAVEVDRDHARHVGRGLLERHAFLEPRDAALPRRRDERERAIWLASGRHDLGRLLT